MPGFEDVVEGDFRRDPDDGKGDGLRRNLDGGDQRPIEGDQHNDGPGKEQDIDQSDAQPVEDFGDSH